MKYLGFVVACVVAVAVSVTAARADFMSSADFSHKYEGGNLDPVSYDLTNDAGTVIYTGGDATASSDGDILSFSTANWSSDEWGTDVSDATGWSVELRARVISDSGSMGAMCLRHQDLTSDPSKLSGLYWIGGEDFGRTADAGTKSVVYQTADNTDAFHTFRIVQPGNSSYVHVFRDGVHVKSEYASLPAASIAQQWKFGDLGGAWAGSMQIDYVRFDNTGPHAPDFLPGRTVGSVIETSGRNAPWQITDKHGSPWTIYSTSTGAWYGRDNDGEDHFRLYPNALTMFAYSSAAASPDLLTPAMNDPNGWRYMVRVKSVSTPNHPSDAAATAYDGSDAWGLWFGVSGANTTVYFSDGSIIGTVPNGYHTCTMRYDPASQTVTISIDGVDRAVKTRAQAPDDSGPRRVLFGDAATGTGQLSESRWSLVRFEAGLPLDPPEAADDYALVAANTSVLIGVLDNDADPNGDALALQSVGTASYGDALVQGSRALYAPDAGYVGSDTFTYVVTDGLSSDTGTVQVIVYDAAALEDPGALRLHWPLDEPPGLTALDASGHGHDGALTNGPAWTWGMKGYALHFDGADDHVVGIGGNSDFNFAHQSGIFTVTAWLRLDSPSADAAQAILGNAASSEETGFCFSWENRAGIGTQHLRLGLYRGEAGVPVMDVLSPPNAVSDGEWHHVAAVADGTNVAFYVDGFALAGDGAIGSLAAGNASAPLHAGRFSDGSGGRLDGALDDVRIYNRALHAVEVAAIAQSADHDGDGFVDDVDFDDDNDGIPDDWENDRGLDPLNAADANRDGDGDGFTGREERIADTDADDSESCFRIVNITREQGRTGVVIDSATERKYTLMRKDGLTNGATWTTVAENVAGTGERLEISDPQYAIGRFYRTSVRSIQTDFEPRTVHEVGRFRLTEGATRTYWSSSSEHVNFPRHTRLLNGDQYVAHSIGVHGQTERPHSVRSSDGGRTWEELPQDFSIPLLVLTNGTALKLDFTGTVVGGNTVRFTRRRSTNHWHTVDVDAISVTFPFNWSSCVAQYPTSLADGTALYAIYGFEQGQSLFTTALIASRDDGVTWSYRGAPARPPYPSGIGAEGADEPAVQELPSGELLCIMRTGSSFTSPFPMLLSRSVDQGYNWSTPTKWNAPGGVDPSLLLLDNDVLVLAVGRPNVHLLFSPAGDGSDWSAPHTIATPGDHYQWLWPLGPDRFLLMWTHTGFLGTNITGPNEVRGTEFRIEKLFGSP